VFCSNNKGDHGAPSLYPTCPIVTVEVRTKKRYNSKDVDGLQKPVHVLRLRQRSAKPSASNHFMTISNLEGYIGLLIQIPLVGIFVWFSLQLISTFLKSIDSRDAQWRLFMEQERKANAEALAHMAQRFSDEIRTLGKEVSELRGTVK